MRVCVCFCVCLLPAEHKLSNLASIISFLASHVNSETDSNVARKMLLKASNSLVDEESHSEDLKMSQHFRNPRYPSVSADTV